MPLGLGAATNDLSGLLQKGLFEEEANRNLEAAAQAYSTVSAQFDKDRKLAATAIFRLGEIYRKQGKTNEAAGQYERIVREFADQDTLVTLSRQNIAGLGVNRKTVGKSEQVDSAVTALTPEAQELARTEKILLQLRGLDLSQLRGLIPNLVPDADFERLNEQLRLNENYGDSPPEKSLLVQREIYRQKLEKRAEIIIDTLQRREDLLKDEVAKQSLSGNPELRPAENKTSVTTTDDEEKEIRRIQAMIQNSPDLINAPGDGGLTPLSRAAAADWLRVAQFLLDNGAAIDRQANNRSALHDAASGGHKAMVELLAGRGADINARDNNGETALHLAAASGYLSVAEALVQRKADLNVHSKKENEGVTPLHRAATQGQREMVAFLLSKGAEIDARDASGMTALVRAAMHGHTEVLNKLLVAGAQPNIEDTGGMTALSYAATRGHLDFMKALLAAKADPNGGKAGAPICWAGTTSKPECVKLLLEAGANPNMKKDDGQTPLLTAIERGYYETVVLLIQHGADVNSANDKRMTPLQMAVWTESIPMVSLLLKNHAEVNAPGPAGRNALIMAQEAMNGSRPYKPGDYGGSGLAPNPLIARKTAALLRQHGALDDLPNLDRIEVRRPSANFSAIAFQMSANGWNEFGLLELIALHYGLISTERNAVWGVNKGLKRDFWRAATCQFPDLSHVVIRRAASAGPQRTEVKVNVAELLDSGDCARDVKLKPGDIIEIPEADHPVNESWTGLGSQQLSNLLHCVSRTVTISIKGTPTTVRLTPQFKQTDALFSPTGEWMYELTRGSFMLKSVLAQSRLLRASSDLSRVKVTRRAEAGGQKQEWLLDCSGNNNPDLWLRDGDVIEVPDKP